ncbi:hypothetical protein PVNG_04195 [Plasmodium vivax North Korean]|uniref:Alpha-carbonic anhydrase domain-containing protein n=2 Tax=Plasmodium vivax TaxID=5855 RepID=A0A0J9TV00_PLAVI|nr:hypothetical protein PVNG_04195 [Plasmodium vivax North Korean]
MTLNIESMELLAHRGSPSVPTCDENIHWKVAKQALPPSTETILNFYKMLKRSSPTYRGSDENKYPFCRIHKGIQDVAPTDVMKELLTKRTDGWAASNGSFYVKSLPTD